MQRRELGLSLSRIAWTQFEVNVILGQQEIALCNLSSSFGNDFRIMPASSAFKVRLLEKLDSSVISPPCSLCQKCAIKI